MNSKIRSSKLAIGAVILFASTQTLASNVRYDYATVIEAEPIIKTVRVSTPREECWDEEVVYRENYADHPRDNSVGTVVGGILGGAIGNAIGHHKKNKQVGAVVGAVLGATLGRAVSANAHAHEESHSRQEVRTEEHCEIRQEYHEEDRIIGYRVRYRYNDETYATRTDIDPGDTIKVRIAISPVL